MLNPDAALVQRAASGDQQAFSALYTRYQRAIYGVIRQMTGDEDVAADLTQEAFVRAWRALPRLRETEAFGGWIRTIATNLVRDRARRQRPEVSMTGATEDDERDFDAPDLSPSVEDQLAQSQQRQLIQQAVLRLPEPQRIVVIMHHFEGVPVADIARELGVPLGTVLSRLARGREALRRRLAPYLENGA
jgi:RNA polymerase sigma-70 factor (ECF subfamily)